MVVDSSAVVAVLTGEPEAMLFVEALSDAARLLMAAPNALEASIVLLRRQGPPGLERLERFMATAGIDIVPFTDEMVPLATEAYERFGKGRHPAQLNFGDACAYALARHAGLPLLFKGQDFARTDITPALRVT
jgi:ribonuclease VapC